MCGLESTHQNYDMAVRSNKKHEKHILAKRRSRSVLSAQQALEIYNAKISNSSAMIKDRISTAQLASKYGVCDKTIRDIWRGNTWTHATWHLDMAKPYHPVRLGRPKGSKDRKPRRPRVVTSIAAKEKNEIFLGADIEILETGIPPSESHNSCISNKLTNSQKHSAAQAPPGSTPRSESLFYHIPAVADKEQLLTNADISGCIQPVSLHHPAPPPLAKTSLPTLPDQAEMVLALSIDDHLHAWATGSSLPPAASDPFHADWQAATHTAPLHDWDPADATDSIRT